MTLEGSRVNPSVTSDLMQDCDITFLVTEIESFRSSDNWLSAFGELIFMQKPEAMDLFPPDIRDYICTLKKIMAQANRSFLPSEIFP